MTQRKVTEAELAIDLAKTFGRTPPSWAVDARRKELGEAGQPTMSVNEALDVKCSAAFGRVSDRGRLAEAETILARKVPASGSSGNAALQQRMTALMNEVSALAESRLGYSAERGKLHAQSEALYARERSSSVKEAVEEFARHRDHLIGRPVYKKVN